MRNQGTPSTPGAGGWEERKGEVNEKGGNLLILSFLRPIPPWKKTAQGLPLDAGFTSPLYVTLAFQQCCGNMCAHTHTMKKPERVRVLFQGKKRFQVCRAPFEVSTSSV